MNKCQGNHFQEVQQLKRRNTNIDEREGMTIKIEQMIEKYHFQRVELLAVIKAIVGGNE